MGATVSRGVCCAVHRVVEISPAEAYQRVVDPVRFAALFHGWGPVPGIASIDADALDAGSKRRVYLRDGTELSETIRTLRAGRLLVYDASGHGPPVCWWATGARAAWCFQSHPRGARIRWLYRFRPRNRVCAMLLGIAVRPVFERAMAAALAAVEEPLQ